MVQRFFEKEASGSDIVFLDLAKDLSGIEELGSCYLSLPNYTKSANSSCLTLMPLYVTIII